jgi:RimJ/RimL family protein N-acetyltransferase
MGAGPAGRDAVRRLRRHERAPHYDAPFVPAVEVGWRQPRAAWGCGYATEAAQAVLEFAFTRLDLAEVVAITVPGNEASRRVMSCSR